LSIDSQTGLLTGVPTAVGQYVVGVCVEEYRNGVLISINKRDFQFNVVSCESNLEAVIPGQETFHNPCDGLQIEFGNMSVNAQDYHWDFGVPAIQNDTSNLETPVYVYPDTGSYEVILIANPGLHCADTTVDVITVYTTPTVEILSSGELCSDENEFDFTAIGEFGSGATFLWEFEDAIPANSTEQNPQGVIFAAVGEYGVILTVQEHICSDEDETTVVTFPRPVAYFSHQKLAGCPPLWVLLLDSSYSATNREITWDLGNGIIESGPHVIHAYTEPGFYDVEITISTSEGCVDTVSYLFENAIEVYPLPGGLVSAEPDRQLLVDPVFQFSGSDSQASTCELLTGDGAFLQDTSANCIFQHTYADTGT
jgi:PKD repeat protein